jgi:hypothetical protein
MRRPCLTENKRSNHFQGSKAPTEFDRGFMTRQIALDGDTGTDAIPAKPLLRQWVAG